MVKVTTQFVCQQCGYSTPRWMGQCPSCGHWNTLVESLVATGTKNLKLKTKNLEQVGPIRLSSVKKAEYQKRVSTGIGELDRVLGGGILPGMVVLVAGEPGIGKSTLLLQLADRIARTSFVGNDARYVKRKTSNDTNFETVQRSNVIYVAGEESATQIANRASRLEVKGEEISVFEETDVDSIVSNLSSLSSLSLIIVDSIQTLTTEDLTGTAGSIGQVRECAGRLAAFGKSTGVPVFLVGHVTKEGSIAGPRVLEHMVDTVLWFEGDRSGVLRVLRSIKNRFGATDEVGIFSMEEKGLIEVSNPSRIFLGENGRVSGSVATAILEGTRIILVEIQALVVPTKLAFPKRVGQGVDQRRLELIIAVLTRRAGLPLWDFDIFVNVAGGIRVEEPGADLAIALAISSAFQDKPLPTGTAAIGEVGLLGEIREVSMQERRAKEARRLGFRNVVTKREARTVGEAIRSYISSK